MKANGLLAPENNMQAPAPEQGQGPDPAVQDTVDMFLANGLRIVHDPKVSDGLINRIVKSRDPAVAVAEATLSVVERLEGSAKENGRSIPMEHLAQVANVLMGEIIQMAETAGMPPLDEEGRYQAYSLAVSKYIDSAVRSGKMPKEQLVQMAEAAKETPEGQKILEAGGNEVPFAQPPGRAV